MNKSLPIIHKSSQEITLQSDSGSHSHLHKGCAHFALELFTILKVLLVFGLALRVACAGSSHLARPVAKTSGLAVALH